MKSIFYQAEWLKTRNENSFRVDILIPLFRVLGFRDIYDYHGNQEYGKDIIMWTISPTNNRENYAVVIKAKRITGSASKDIADISVQINQAFTKKYNDKNTGEERQIQKVIIACSHNIKPQAVEAIFAGVKYDRNLIEIMDCEKIIDLLNENKNKLGVFPIITSQLEHIRQKYKLDIISIQKSEGKQKVIINPSKKSPIDLMSGEIELDKSGFTVFSEYLKDGRRCEIDKDNIKKLMVPEIIDDIIHTESESVKIELGDRSVDLKFKIAFCSAEITKINESFIFETGAIGSESITIIYKDVYLYLEFILNVIEQNKNNFRFNMELDFNALNAHQIYEYNKIVYDILNSEKIKFVDISTNIEHFNLTLNKTYDIINRQWLNILEKLDYIQGKIKKVIYLPDRDLLESEIETIYEIFQIVTAKRRSIEKGEIKLSIKQDANNHKIKNGPFTDVFVLEIKDNRNLFGNEIDLGKAKLFIKKGIFNVADEGDLVNVKITFDKDSNAEIIYEEE